MNGEDPTVYVLSANVHRRNISTGQRAMAIAMLSPEPEKLKRKQKTINGEHGVSQQRLSDARAVLQYAPDLADNVLSGSSSLDDAYKTPRERKDSGRRGKRKLSYGGRC